MTVLFYGSVKDYTLGEKSFDAHGAQSVHMLIDMLGKRFGDSFSDFLLGDETCFFLVNGNSIIATGGLNTQLSSDDTVEILPFVDGG